MPTFIRQPSFASLPPIPAERMTPLVELNAGGVPYTVPQAALTRFPHSDLAHWASGALKPPRDGAGRIFVNRDGAGMQALVSYLRGGLPMGALRDDQLAILQADGEALKLGRKFVDTVRWERLRRQVEAQPLDLHDAARAQPALGHYLDFLAVNEGLGLPPSSPELQAVVRALPGPCAEHCVARLTQRPDDWAELRQAMLVAANGEQHAAGLDGLALASRVLQQNPNDMEAQVCWTQTTTLPARHTPAPPGSVDKLCALLRSQVPQGRGAALAARLEREPLFALHAKFARPEHRDEAIEAALLVQEALHKGARDASRASVGDSSGTGARDVSRLSVRDADRVGVLYADRAAGRDVSRAGGCDADRSGPTDADRAAGRDRYLDDARTAADWLLRYGLAAYAHSLFSEVPDGLPPAWPDWFSQRVQVVETLLRCRDTGRSLGARVPLGCFGHAEVEALWDTLWRVYAWRGDTQFLSAGVQRMRVFEAREATPDLATLICQQTERVRDVLAGLPKGSAEAGALEKSLT